jgi:TPR repeat protein
MNMRELECNRVRATTLSDCTALQRHMRMQSSVAQFTLGRMYETGRGVAADTAEAIRLYRLAAAQGHAYATAALARLGA